MDERDGDVKPLLLLTMLSMMAARVTCSVTAVTFVVCVPSPSWHCNAFDIPSAYVGIRRLLLLSLLHDEMGEACVMMMLHALSLPSL